MTWTDERGVTHAVATLIHIDGTVVPMVSQDSKGAIGWMRCGRKATSSSLRPVTAVDCMSCLVKGAT